MPLKILQRNLYAAANLPSERFCYWLTMPARDFCNTNPLPQAENLICVLAAACDAESKTKWETMPLAAKENLRLLAETREEGEDVDCRINDADNPSMLQQTL